MFAIFLNKLHNFFFKGNQGEKKKCFKTFSSVAQSTITGEIKQSYAYGNQQTPSP